MTDNGDDWLRESGIKLPCAKHFGFAAHLRRCDRPYGHTGAHTAEGFHMSGGRNAEDEARTSFVLHEIMLKREQQS